MRLAVLFLANNQCQQKQDCYDSLLSFDLGICNDSILVFHKWK